MDFTSHPIGEHGLKIEVLHEGIKKEFEIYSKFFDALKEVLVNYCYLLAGERMIDLFTSERLEDYLKSEWMYDSAYDELVRDEKREELLHHQLLLDMDDEESHFNQYGVGDGSAESDSEILMGIKFNLRATHNGRTLTIKSNDYFGGSTMVAKAINLIDMSRLIKAVRVRYGIKEVPALTHKEAEVHLIGMYLNYHCDKEVDFVDVAQMSENDKDFKKKVLTISRTNHTDADRTRQYECEELSLTGGCCGVIDGYRLNYSGGLSKGASMGIDRHEECDLLEGLEPMDDRCRSLKGVSFWKTAYEILNG